MNIFQTRVTIRRENGVQNKDETDLEHLPKDNELTNFLLNYCSKMFVRGQKGSNVILEIMQSCNKNFMEK